MQSIGSFLIDKLAALLTKMTHEERTNAMDLVPVRFVYRGCWSSTVANDISLRECRMRLPPSPPSKWSIIGHMHLLGPPTHKSMAQLSKKCGPLMFLQLGTRSHVVVSSFEMEKEIFKRHDLTFSHRPYLVVMD